MNYQRPEHVRRNVVLPFDVYPVSLFNKQSIEDFDKHHRVIPKYLNR